jgi:hypothetical protein
MKTKPKALKMPVTILLFILSIGTFAQATHRLGNPPEFKVSGTSTLHDWDMISNQAEGYATIIITNNTIEKITSLKVIMNAESLKSGKNRMDEIAHKTLDSKKHPNIEFIGKKINKITDKTIEVNGVLTIAGTGRNVDITLNYTLTGQKVYLTGELPITFTQFNMEPPRAMMGTIRTGDELLVTFKTNLNPYQQ